MISKIFVSSKLYHNQIKKIGIFSNIAAHWLSSWKEL